MAKRTCSIEGCERKAKCRGWCSAHYTRWRRNGDPLAGVVRYSNDEDRFWAKVDKNNDCWLWTASTGPFGYGQFNTGHSVVRSHRFAYEMTIGSIPPGKELDHICRNRLCVRPEHLRPVTRQENNQNKAGPSRNCKSGVRGVSWVKHAQRWRATVRHDGIQHHVGYFVHLAEAEAAVVAKRNELFTHNDADRQWTVSA